MTFLDLAKTRYSARQYSDRPVEQEKLGMILEAGRVAPTAANKQPQRIIVVRSKDGLKKLTQGANFYNAPLVLIICSDTENTWMREYDGKNNCDIDASIVTDHMMLAATDLGLNSLWMTWFNPAVIQREFHLPETVYPVNLLALGYSDEPAQSPDRHAHTRRPLAETVFYESW